MVYCVAFAIWKVQWDPTKTMHKHAHSEGIVPNPQQQRGRKAAISVTNDYGDVESQQPSLRPTKSIKL